MTTQTPTIDNVTLFDFSQLDNDPRFSSEVQNLLTLYYSAHMAALNADVEIAYYTDEIAKLRRYAGEYSIKVGEVLTPSVVAIITDLREQAKRASYQVSVYRNVLREANERLDEIIPQLEQLGIKP